MVLQNAAEPGRKWAYRGQSDPGWALETSYSRFFGRNFDSGVGFDLGPFSGMLTRFLLRASEFTGTNFDHLGLFQQIAMAQHHGIPTPLLDWTFSPYIATYFAVLDAAPRGTREVEFAVFAINAAGLQPDEISDGHERGPLLDSAGPFLFIDTRNFVSRRISRQRGCFTFHGFRECLTVWSVNRGPSQIKKYVIRDSRDNIVRELRLMGLSGGDLFDDLDYVARDVQAEEEDAIRLRRRS
jgi:FRG domain